MAYVRQCRKRVGHDAIDLRILGLFERRKGGNMARVISVRDEYLAGSNEVTLKSVLERLHEAFMLIDLGDYRIEVHEQDYAAVCQLLEACRRDTAFNAAH